MKTIAVLRAYPKDASLGKVLEFLSRRYRVECLVWDRQGDYVPLVENDRIAHRRCRIRAGYYDLATLVKLCLFQVWLFVSLLFTRCDAIHAMDLDTGLVGLWVARLRGKPFVYHCLDPYHAALPPGWPPVLASLARWLEGVVIDGADLFVITDLKRLPQHGPVRPRRLTELANVPLPDLSALPETPHDGFIVGYVGSQVPGRNLETIVDAAAGLADQGVALVLGGFGPLAEAVAARAAGKANIRFLSWVPAEELYPLERTFDCFLHVTDRENPAYRWVSPNKLFEAMALGRPIIVGEGTLAAERVAAIGNGLAVPYGNREALMAAILRLKDDPALARQMGERGRAEFEANWRPEVMAQRLLGAYGAVVKGEG